MLQEFAVDSTRARDGRSIIHFAETGPLPRRTAYFWCHKLVDAGYLRVLPQRAPDAKDAIPAHWRVTRGPATQMKTAMQEFPQWKFLSQEPTWPLPLPQRHRVTRCPLAAEPTSTMTSSPNTMADMLGSPTIATNAPIRLEPWHRLTVVDSERPWTFSANADHWGYQPDAMFNLRTTATFYALEYERLQSRRKAWGHIERF